MHNSKKSLSELKIIYLFPKMLSDSLRIKAFSQKSPSKNPFPVGIFILCLLFSFNSFAANRFLRLILGGKPTESVPVESPSGPTAEEVANYVRQEHNRSIGDTRRISGDVIDHLSGIVDEQFNRTLDEILETRQIENLPEAMLDELRAATMDPLRLFDPDNPQEFASAVNFNLRGLVNQIPLPGQFTEQTLAYRDIYRAFFQKRLDPKNREQMYRLRNLLDRYSDSEITPDDVLRFLCKHDSFEESAYQKWADEIMVKLYRNDIFKKMADSCFENGFDEKAFFTLWEDPPFRKFIVDSKFMKRHHLAGNMDLLIKWWREFGFSVLMDDQFNTLVKASFNEAALTSNARQTLDNDPFWQTVQEAANNDSGFSDSVERLMRKMTPLKEDKPSYGSGDGGFA